jgi:hypothetical protein
VCIFGSTTIGGSECYLSGNLTDGVNKKSAILIQKALFTILDGEENPNR